VRLQLEPDKRVFRKKENEDAFYTVILPYDA
jgi:hypothetical protein